MSTFITVIHVLSCFFLVVLVLLQSGKGAEISASFAGGSQTVFGTSGGINFVQKLTGIFAAIFFVTSLGLTVISGQSRKSVFDGAPVAAPTSAAPATAPVTAAPAPVETKKAQ